MERDSVIVFPTCSYHLKDFFFSLPFCILFMTSGEFLVTHLKNIILSSSLVFSPECCMVWFGFWEGFLLACLLF